MVGEGCACSSRGLGTALLSWYESGLQGRIPETTPVGMSGKAIDALNQKIFTQYRQCALKDVLAQFHASYQQVLAVVPGDTGRRFIYNRALCVDWQVGIGGLHCG